MLERRNPLPPGRYWQDIFAPNFDAFHAWLVANKESVHVEVAQSFSGKEPEMNIPNAIDREFYIFTVSDPVTWDQTHWGFPTLAGKNVTTSDDTVQRPPKEKDILDQVSDALPSPAGVIGTIEGLLIAGVAIAILLAVLKTKNRS